MYFVFCIVLFIYFVTINQTKTKQSVIGFRPAFNWQYNGASGGDPGNATHIAGRINNLKVLFILILIIIYFYFLFIIAWFAVHFSKLIVYSFQIGSIQYVYIIQNTPVDMVFDMVSQLDDHVQVFFPCLFHVSSI